MPALRDAGTTPNHPWCVVAVMAVVAHAARQMEAALAAGNPAAVQPRPRQPAVVVCAWCLYHGRPHGAVRAPQERHWRAVSHEYARAQILTGQASHGLCLACRPAVIEAWGLEAPPRPHP